MEWPHSRYVKNTFAFEFFLFCIPRCILFFLCVIACGIEAMLFYFLSCVVVSGASHLLLVTLVMALVMGTHWHFLHYSLCCSSCCS